MDTKSGSEKAADDTAEVTEAVAVEDTDMELKAQLSGWSKSMSAGEVAFDVAGPAKEHMSRLGHLRNSNFLLRLARDSSVVVALMGMHCVADDARSRAMACHNLDMMDYAGYTSY